MKTLTCLAVLLASTALAQSSVTLIDAPLDVRLAQGKTAVQRVQSGFRLALARNRGVLVPTRSNWQAAIDALSRHDCDIHDECLSELATTARVLYALQASVESNVEGTQFIATGRVVNRDGHQARALERVVVPATGKVETDALTALKALLDKLDLSSLSPVLSPPEPVAPVVVVAPPREIPPPVVLTPPSPPPPQLVATTLTPSPWRPAAYALLAASIASAVACLVIGLSASSLRSSLPVDGAFTSLDDARRQLVVNQRATLSLGFGLGAATGGLLTALVWGVTATPAAEKAL